MAEQKARACGFEETSDEVYDNLFSVGSPELLRVNGACYRIVYYKA